MSDSNSGDCDLATWMANNWDKVLKHRYVLWQDSVNEFCMLAHQNGIIFYTVSPERQLRLLTREEAYRTLVKLAKEIRIRVRRGRAGEFNRVMQAHSARIQRILRWLFDKRLDSYYIHTFVLDQYGLNTAVHEHDVLLPDIAENPRRPRD